MRTSRLKKKKPDKEYRSTIKELHDKKIIDYLEYYKTIPKKQKELEKLQKKYNKIDPNDYKIRTEKLNLKDVIDSLIRELNDMKRQNGLSEYLLDAHPVLLRLGSLEYYRMFYLRH